MSTSKTANKQASSSTINLSLVVPCYNESEVFEETCSRLLRLLSKLIDSQKINSQSSIYFVDDGSRDATWDLIVAAANHDARIKGIKLSRNRGHQNALLAGLTTVEGDAIVSIDADLQDDITVIETMVDLFAEGNDVVYGVRKSRHSDTFFKRNTAVLYYRIIKIMGVDIVFNHADYRLLSRRAIEALKEYGEVNLFLRGIVPSLGFQSTIVEYDRTERFAGESKYPLSKMIALAIDGVTSFSSIPLRMIALLGMMVFVGSLFMSAWVLFIRIFSDQAIPGWASSVLPMYFLGGVQLLSLGVLGEYVAKIYMETKKRPRFIIEKTIDRVQE